MTGKERYYALDEIGFVGVQDKRSKTQIRKDMDDTNRYIKAMTAKTKCLAAKKRASRAK